MSESKFKIGDIVQIAPNPRLLDCCQGKRGRIAHRPAGVLNGNSWLLVTDHFCPVIRTEEEYFDFEDCGWKLFESYEEAYREDKTIFKRADGSAARHAQVLIEANFDPASRLAVV
jgi:hypothetical protein